MTHTSIWENEITADFTNTQPLNKTKIRFRIWKARGVRT